MFTSIESEEERPYTWYPTRLPFPIHSPMKNQQAISIPTTVFSTVWLTVHVLKVCFWALAILVDMSPMATATSPGEGGASSTCPIQYNEIQWIGSVHVVWSEVNETNISFTPP